MKTVGKESLLQNQLHYLSFPKGWKKTQLPLKSKLDKGRVSLKAENNNRMKKCNSLVVSAGINFPQE